jgi:isopropylmalate/homocitrate/citramalate synthase
MTLKNKPTYEVIFPKHAGLTERTILASRSSSRDLISIGVRNTGDDKHSLRWVIKVWARVLPWQEVLC